MTHMIVNLNQAAMARPMIRILKLILNLEVSLDPDQDLEIVLLA